MYDGVGFELLIIMKLRTKRKTKELTKTILELLAVNTGASLVILLDQGRHTNKLTRALASYNISRIRETMKRLAIQNYIQYRPQDDTAPIILTSHGMVRRTCGTLKEFHHQRLKKWDYLWRMIVFDIPEMHKRSRKILSGHLQKIGLFQLQRSVYVTPFCCEDSLLELFKNLGVQRYVLLFTTASLGSAEGRVREHYFDRHQLFRRDVGKK